MIQSGKKNASFKLKDFLLKSLKEIEKNILIISLDFCHPI